MRFYFCGGLDCPDWVLVQIAYASKMTLLKFRSLFKEVLSTIYNGDVHDENIHKLAISGQYQRKDIELCFAGVLFILRSACSHETGVEILSDELQQLGLPKEHAQALCKTYASEFETIRQSLADKCLKLDSISTTECSSTDFEDSRIIRMEFGVKSTLDDSVKDYKILASKERVSLLLDDLKKISAEMS